MLIFKLVPKGTYLFLQGDNSNGFYGIIKGKISISKIDDDSLYKIKDFPEYEKISYFLENEQKLFSLGSGKCFGEWGLIGSLPRRASAYAEEDSYLLCLEQEFNFIGFAKALQKADLEKKQFLKKKFPFLSELGPIKFEQFYSNFIFKVYVNSNINYASCI